MASARPADICVARSSWMFCIIKLLMRVLCNKVVGCCTYIYIFVCVYMRVNWLECCKIIGQVLAVRTSRILASLVRRTSENNSLFLSLDFILELSKQLIGDFSSRKRITMRESPSASEIHKRKIQHTWQRLPGNKRRCKGCYQQRRRLETVYGCAMCNSHMCDGCFRRLHEHHGDEADA